VRSQLDLSWLTDSIALLEVLISDLNIQFTI